MTAQDMTINARS